MKKISSIGYLFLLVCLLTGCSFSANVSAFSMETARENSVSRSSSYWSGIQMGSKIAVNEGEEIRFHIEMEKGSVAFTLKDSDGNDIYTLTKEGEYSGTETYTAEADETFWLVEKGVHFKGTYRIEWGEEEGSEEANQ